ncbi:MAG: hypothetical protein LBC88_09530, partial [Spirochaetaceae bacterium]|nr:hypothetical protein [Spirochaetaceae bacterium]
LVSYLAAGAVPDPNYDDGQFQISEAFFTADFWYRRSFNLPEAWGEAAGRIFLNFDMINWKADVWLNGEVLPNADPARARSIEGAFVRGRFDITSRAQKGVNYLAVRIYRNDTPGEVTTQGLAEGPLPNGGALGADNPTIHAAVGWDWLPTIRGRDTGIIEDVYLSYSLHARLLDPWMETRLSVSEKSAAIQAEDLARAGPLVITSPDDYTETALAALTDGREDTQWIGKDTDGTGFTIDMGREITTGSVTIVWGTETGFRAADLESRHPETFALESSVDGKTWVNFDAFPGGEVDGKWFGRLAVPESAGTGAFTGHAISGSVQGSTAVAQIDFGALGWGEGIVPIPFFTPQKARYIRFTILRRRTVNGAPVPARIRAFHIYAESVEDVERSLLRDHILDDSKADLVFRTEIANSGGDCSALVRGRILPGDIVFEKTFSLAAGETLSAEIDHIIIEKPELWWPNTYGKQFLYTACAEVLVNGAVSDRKTFRFGVRQFTYPVDGNMLTLYCNGTRIVCKGGNWGMDDGLKRDTPAVYDSKVRLHAEANFTMIRNWVGMTNHRAFYDACDKYGVLIWDDFWLANPMDGPDPNDAALFLDNAVDKIRRVRSHAALALYCGRNEANPPPAIDAGLRERTAAHDGTRFYVPNSAMPPVGSGGGYSLAAPGGNNGIKQYFNDVTSPVLRSERGIPNVPAAESIRKFVRAENRWPISEVWALHDWTYHMNGPANTYMAALKCYMDGAFDIPADTVRDQNPSPDDPVFRAYKKDILKMVRDAGTAYRFEDFCRMAQMINFENHKGLFEALAARRSNGLLMWMSQSSWPSFMWQTYDWYLDINGGYFGVRAGNQPVHPAWDPRDDSIFLVNATPKQYDNITVLAAVFDLAGRRILEREYAMERLESDASGRVIARADFSASPTDVVFLRLTLRSADGTVLGGNFYWHNRAVYQDYRALNTLPPAPLDIRAAGKETLPDGSVLCRFEIANNSGIPAVQTRVRLLADGADALPVFYSDNYFALMPGERTVITAETGAQYGESESLSAVLGGWNTAASVCPAG